MAAKKKKRPAGKTFRFQLSVSGIVGICIVSFCLFLWMFLLGIWAGQTILLPAARPSANRTATTGAPADLGGGSVKTIVSGAKTKPGTASKQK